MTTDNSNKILNAPVLRFQEFEGEWKKCKIKDYGSIVTGNTPPTNDYENYANGTFMWASPSDLGQSKYICETKTKLSKVGFEKTRILPKDSILVTCIGSTIGKMGMAEIEMSTNQQINSVIVNKEEYDKDFVYYTIMSRFPKYLISIAIQAVPILSKSTFEQLDSFHPIIDEQKRIGKLLDAIDKRIDTQSRAIEDLKQLKAALIEVLYKQISPNQRIGDIVVQVSTRNRSGYNYSVLSVNNRLGFIEQSEQFEDRMVASEDTSNYKIVNRNDFAYNPARINVGSIARLTSFENGIVSPMYICFHTKKQILPEYLEYFFDTRYFNYKMQKRLEGSIRLCLSWEGLCNIPITVPSIEEQRKTSKRVSKIVEKITLEEHYLDLLKMQKQYLLDTMFI